MWGNHLYCASNVGSAQVKTTIILLFRVAANANIGTKKLTTNPTQMPTAEGINSLPVVVDSAK
jgi:hypothetical protein